MSDATNKDALHGLCASMRSGPCNEPIAYRDASFTYCEHCGAARRASGVHVRKLSKREIAEMRRARETNPQEAITVERLGGITKITPHTDAARQWLETNANAEIWQWQDGALVVDTRAAAELLETIERRER